MVFAYNAWQYATVEDRFSGFEGSSFVVELVRESDMKRMTIFGPIAAVFGGAGLVLGLLGVRRR